jgi:hypothetical protein
MRRRDFIAGLGSVAIAWPFAMRAHAAAARSNDASMLIHPMRAGR